MSDNFKRQMGYLLEVLLVRLQDGFYITNNCVTMPKDKFVKPGFIF
ncbi:hypothetical protein [Flavobacterium sp. ZB4R12]